MIKKSEKAPEFDLTDDSGTDRSLSALLANGPVVLFFYPAAMTSGCTAESCHFRDLSAEFAQYGGQPVGISVDSVAKQHEFSQTHGFGYPLLSDPDGSVAEAYGVKRKFGPTPVKRSTFVIGTDGLIKDVIASEIRMKVHADRALKALAEL